MAKPKILIVEDERIVAENIQRTLRNFDYVVSSIVSSGEEALKEAEEHKPDLVLMDIKLRGDIDGVEAAERIRTRFDIPIIYITALADRITVQRAKMTEPFGYIHKPIEEKELLSTIEIAFYRHNMELKLKESEEKYRTLFEDSRDAIYITSQDGKIIDFNQSFLDLFGFTGEEIKGMKVQERYVHPGDRKRFQEVIERKGSVRDYEVKLCKKDGTEMDCLITATVRRAHDGRILGYQGNIRDITERKRAQEEIRKSEERYRNIVELAPYGIVTLDLKGVFTLCNTAFLNLSGFSRGEIVNKHFTKIPTLRAKDIPKYIKDIPKYIKIFNSIIQGEVAKPIEFQWIHKNGTIRVGEGHASLIKRGDKTIGFQAIIRDITKRKQMEEALKESEKRYKELWDNAPVAYHTVDTKGIIISVNQTEAKMLGYTTEEMIGKSIFEFVLLEQQAEARKRFRQKISGDRISRAVNRIYVKKDGSKIYVAIDDVLERDDKGKVIGIRTTMVDITKRKRAEEALRESEERYRAIFEQAADSIVLIDVETGALVEFNDRAHENLGYTREEFKKLKIPEFEVIESAEEVAKHIEKIVKEGADTFETKHRTKGGEIRDILVSSRAISIRGKDFIQSIWRDITERKRAEEELRKSEERYRSLFEGVPVGLYRSTPEGKRIDANTSLMQMLGYPNLETFLEGNVVDDYVTSEDRRRWQDQIEREGVVRGFEVQERRQDGTLIWVRDSSRVVQDSKGHVLYYEGAVEDITERKRAEEEKEKLQAQLVQSEKMAGLGTLASGVAHEFNNLLQIMSGHVQIAQKTKKREDIEEAFDIVLDTSDRATKIIKDLLSFSKTETVEKEPYDITEPIESVLSIIEEQLLKHNIRVVRKYEKIPLIEVNKAEMEQVFLNMVTNARDAMLPKGGKLEIGVKRIKESVEMSFRDTGRGIKKENLNKVFDPFYTTKGVAGGSDNLPGTGLGLSVSYGIVKRHGGTIKVESKVGRGTTFTVKLPVKGA